MHNFRKCYSPQRYCIASINCGEETQYIAVTSSGSLVESLTTSEGIYIDDHNYLQTYKHFILGTETIDLDKAIIIIYYYYYSVLISNVSIDS